MRSKFDKQLDLLNTELIAMGSFCENIISMVSEGLTNADDEFMKQVAEVGGEIDQKERDIERLCMKLLLQQQPVAKDLRLISAALKMITDLERIGDQAEDISEIIHERKIKGQAYVPEMKEMAKATTKMVTESIDAYVKSDIEIAKNVVKYDDVVDNHFDDIKEKLVASLKKGGTEAEYALDMLMIAKYFERIGDHSTNVAEWVLFSITGEHK